MKMLVNGDQWYTDIYKHDFMKASAICHVKSAVCGQKSKWKTTKLTDAIHELNKEIDKLPCALSHKVKGKLI